MISPLSNEIKKAMVEKALMVRMMADLLKLHEQVLKSIEEYRQLIEKKVGPKGDKGDSGESPEIDYDYLIQELKKALPKVEDIAKLVPVPEVKDGNNPTVEEMIVALKPHLPKYDIEMIAEKASQKIKPKMLKETLKVEPDEMFIDKFFKLLEKGKVKFNYKHIDGLEQTINAFSNQLGRGYLHGGGDTIKAGSNITITRNADGTTTVASTASGGGGFTTLPATETPNGSLQVFTFNTATAQPSYIIADNVWLRATTAAGTVNWTWNAGTKKATLTVAPTDDILAVV